MDLSGLNSFAILLWKNFTLKRRRFIALAVEIMLTLLFSGVLLMTRNLIDTEDSGPLRYSALPISDVPEFLRSPNLFHSPWELAYLPARSVLVKKIIERVKYDLDIDFKVQGFSSQSDFEEHLKYENYSKKVLAAVAFDHDFKDSHDRLPLQLLLGEEETVVPEHLDDIMGREMKKHCLVKYYLRFSCFQRNDTFPGRFYVKSWSTDLLFPPDPSLEPRAAEDPTGGQPGYIREGFLLLQHAVDKAIMLYHSNQAAEQLFRAVSVFVQRFPYRIYHRDFFFNFFGIFMPLIILFMFSMNHFTLIQSIVWEKENRLKEYQLMIGLSNWMLWAAYFITFIVLYLIVILFMCMTFFAKVHPVPILQHSDPSLIFIFLLCFAIASIFFSFMVSTFFNKAFYAVFFGGFLYFVSYFPYTIISRRYARVTFTQKLASCLCSNTAMALGTQFLVRAEANHIGIKWSNILSSTKTDNFVFAYVLGMLLFDAFLYGLVTWYIEAVFPGEYGVPKPWNFFLLHSYWSGQRTEKNTGNIPFYESVQSQYFETEPSDLVPGIQIKHLCKAFQVQNTVKIAVKNLSLNLFEGEITVLLGQNGAGKSTTLSVLSGLYPPTSGKAYINGYDISRDMVHIRKNLGLCPQQDLLFNYLTVSEHLYFYCVIKGIPQKERHMEIYHMLSAFNLLEKRDAFSQSLSGGMKRKLSIIIALLGGSKVVILDEPTLGMDPVSRRATWNLLQQYKQDRTILLTTHYMDEADILGDHIAIMVRGTLQCYGTSIFLKQIYGVGYHITMVKEPHCQVEEISQLIYHHIPTATLKDNVGSELSFILPKEYTHRFEVLFTDLEEKQKELGIASFGTSITTMEEVFLRVSDTADAQDLQAIQTPIQMMHKIIDKSHDVDSSTYLESGCYSTVSESSAVEYNTGWLLYLQQFQAMFVKRALFSWRNRKPVLLQILGLLGVLTFLLKAQNFLDKNDETVTPMNLRQYGQTFVPVSISGNSNLTRTLLKHLETVLESEGQILQKVQGDLLNYLMENTDCIRLCIVAFSIEEKTDKTVLTALFNNEAYHSPSASLAVLDNILFMSLSGPDASITVFNKPQPHSGDFIGKSTNGDIVAFFVQFGMALMVSGFSILTVTERVTEAKHIQFLSGICVFIYWISALLWDFIVFFVFCCLLLGVFEYCKVDILVMNYHFLDTVMILMLYGWSAILLMYLLSFLFSMSATAYFKLVLFNYISGVFCHYIDFTVRYNTEIGSLMSSNTRSLILNTLLLFPNYNLAKCFSEYFTFYQKKQLCDTVRQPLSDLHCNKEDNIYSLGKNMIGNYLTAMGTSGFVFLLLILFWDVNLWKLKMFLHRYIYFGVYRKFNKDVISSELSGKCEDEDVERERKRVLEQPHDFLNTRVLIKELTKIYFQCPSVLAVKNISLAIQKGECFGLLGFNGAGKTSTFQMLTGEKTATSGDMFIEGISIIHNILKLLHLNPNQRKFGIITKTMLHAVSWEWGQVLLLVLYYCETRPKQTKTFMEFLINEVRSRIGYCPQSDTLLEYMTGREILTMYARIWGVSEPQIHLYVSSWLNSLHLESHADKLIYTYSAGNRRCLSTAIALMGTSSAIFLDEPSAGMDPVARRLLWNLITQMCQHGKAVIVTSHSMEECEVLCTRLAIMEKGKLMCLGSPQHLKNKFGHLYILKVKVKPDRDKDKLDDLKNFISTTFPGSVIKQETQRTVNYYIPCKDNSWAKVFGILEGAKEQFDLEDYSISQVTLEQVFLTFAH